MFGSNLIHISKRTLHIILGIGFALIVLFFALTRTQVGRDELGKQLEKEFASRYEGELKIGTLTGNLLSTLYAQHVQLLDPDGVTLISVDSVMIRPKWTYLFQKKFSVHKLTILRPNVNVTWDSSGVLGLSKLFSKRTTAVQNRESTWRLQGAAIEIQQGRLITESATPQNALIQKGQLFDFANTTVDQINLLANLDFSEENQQVDILRLSGLLEDFNLPVESGESQFVLRDNRIAINQFGLKIGNSDLSLSGFWETSSEEVASIDRSFLLDIDSQNMDFEELSFVLPKAPVGSSAALSAHIQGPISDLTISWIRLHRNDSFLEFAGTISGYPSKLSVDLSLSNSTFQPSDLNALLPIAAWDSFLKVESVSATAYVQGTAELIDGKISKLAGRSSFDLSSDSGLLSASVQLNGSLDSLGHVVSIHSEQIDLSKWIGKNNLSSDLTGTYRAEGYSVGFANVFSELKGEFIQPSLGNRNAKKVEFDLDLERRSIGGSILLTGNKGTLQVDGDAVLSEAPWIEFSSKLTGLDIGPMVGESRLSTSLTGSLSASSSLHWGRMFSGTLDLKLDSSMVSIGSDSTFLDPFSAQLTIRNPEIAQTPELNHGPDNTNAPLLELTSDFANLSMSGSGSIPTWTQLSQSWISGVRLAILQEKSKTLFATSKGEDAFPDSPLNDILLWEEARSAYSASGLTAPLEAQLTLEITDAHHFSTLIPNFSDLIGTARFESRVIMSPDTISFSTQAHSDRLSIASNGIVGSNGSLQLAANRVSGIARSLEWTSQFSVDSLHVGSNDIIRTMAVSSFGSNHGQVQITSEGTDRIDSIRVAFDLGNNARFNEVRFTEIGLVTDGGFWLLQQPASVRLYGDAITVSGFEVRNYDSNGPTDQRIMASGTFTSAADESLIIGLNEISLRDISGFANLKPVLGGIINTQFALTGGLAQPKLAGSAQVESFSLDHRILGDLAIESSFQSGSADTEVSLNLTQIPLDRGNLIAGTTIPGELLNNSLTVNGRIRLPGLAQNTESLMDLQLDIHRADLFFLKYIFNDAIGTVTGYLSGDGDIKGSFSYPLFDINLGLINGRFDIPVTKSVYQLVSDIRIDEEAIHLDSARITDQQGGFADLSGRILFNSYQFFTLDIGGRLNELQIMNVAASSDLPFYGFLWASGDITLNGPLYNATLFSANAVTRSNSELFIPIEEELSQTDESFIVFEDSVGVIPDFKKLSARPSILARRPTAERRFLDGLNLDLSIFAPQGSTVHLVIDPLLGDVINAKSTGTVQLIRGDDAFQVFGQLAVEGGDYLFTAGELFFRRFTIDDGGTITWDGDPVNARLDIPASYRTRASRAGLPGSDASQTSLIPLIVNLQISGTVNGPQVDLSLSIDQGNQNVLGDYKALEAQLNQQDRATEYATSVLLTNSFQLTTDNLTSDSGSQLAFNSVSQLVSAQLNRFLNEALPNVDFSFGLLGESAADLDVTYGVALRLLDERLIIRGEGVYQGARATENVRANEGLQGEFVVEIRISPNVSVEVFFRREGDILETSELTNTTGVGVSYQTDFESWGSLFRRITNNQQEQD